MNPDEWFQLANSIALAGWLTLALSPLAPLLLQVLGGTIIPLVLSVGYTAMVLAHWADGRGGFDSLRSVEQLFQNRWLRWHAPDCSAATHGPRCTSPPWSTSLGWQPPSFRP